MKLVYICSPLRGHYGENIRNANRYCEIAMDLGVLALAPHTIFTQYLNDTLPEQREQGLKMGLGLLEKCDEVWRMGTVVSAGMKGETELALKLGIPVYDVHTPFEPHTYPFSADNRPLLGLGSCRSGSGEDDFEPGDILVCRHSWLNVRSRTPLNQLWRVSHGNGCKPGAIGRSIFCEHVTDGDTMAFHREDVYGVARPEVLAAVMAAYERDSVHAGATEPDGEEFEP